MKILPLGLLLFCAARSFAALDLTQFPEADEILLGTISAEVQPIRQLRIKAPVAGLLHLRLPPAGTRLTKGTIWAEFEPARLEIEREALELARELLDAREVPSLRLEHARTRADLNERLEEIERQAAMLRRILQQPDLADLYLNQESSDAGQPHRVRSMLDLLERQAAPLREVLRYVGSPRQDELELRVLRLKLEQQQLDLDRRVRDSRLAMPFDGEITLVPPLPPPGDPLLVESGMDLARLQDFSRITARAVVRRSEWRLVDASRVSLRIPAGGGELRAIHSRSLAEDVFGREELVYYFAFHANQTAPARALVGGQVSAQLMATLPAPARLVPKLVLILANPALFQQAGWEGAVPELIPGARVVLVGETHVAIATAAP